jgi:hypothetical protein
VKLEEFSLPSNNKQQLNEFIVPLIIVGGVAWTAYDTYMLTKRYHAGEITATELAQQVGIDVAFTIAGGAVGKLVNKGWKAWKRAHDAKRGREAALKPLTRAEKRKLKAIEKAETKHHEALRVDYFGGKKTPKWWRVKNLRNIFISMALPIGAKATKAFLDMPLAQQVLHLQRKAQRKVQKANAEIEASRNKIEKDATTKGDAEAYKIKAADASEKGLNIPGPSGVWKRSDVVNSSDPERLWKYPDGTKPEASVKLMKQWTYSKSPEGIAATAALIAKRTADAAKRAAEKKAKKDADELARTKEIDQERLGAEMAIDAGTSTGTASGKVVKKVVDAGKTTSTKDAVISRATTNTTVPGSAIKKVVQKAESNTDKIKKIADKATTKADVDKQMGGGKFRDPSKLVSYDHVKDYGTVLGQKLAKALGNPL